MGAGLGGVALRRGIGSKIERPLTARQLRQLVTDLKACLSALPQRQAKLLTLLSGVGLRRGFTRTEAARILRVSRAREGQIERSAVDGLRWAASHDGCASALSAKDSLAQGLELFTGPTAGGLFAGFTSGAALGELGQRARHSVSSANAGPRSPVINAGRHGGGNGILLVVVAGLFVLGAWLVLSDLHSRRSPAH